MPYISSVFCLERIICTTHHLGKREGEWRLNVFNALGLQAGRLALKLSNFYLGRITFKIFILGTEKDLSKKRKKKFPL